MKILLFIGLLFALIVYGWKIFASIFYSVKILRKNEKTLEVLLTIYPKFLEKKQYYILYAGIIEHLIIFASILTSIIIIF